MEQERELLKGNTPTLILAVLREEPRHGYAIAREVERLSNSELKFKDGTLYPALQQLEQEQLIVGAWEASDNAPPRKVYRITQAGREELERRTGVWKRFASNVSAILGLAPEPHHL